MSTTPPLASRCEVCGQRLERRRYANGSLEKRTRFAKRTVCKACSILDPGHNAPSGPSRLETLLTHGERRPPPAAATPDLLNRLPAELALELGAACALHEDLAGHLAISVLGDDSARRPRLKA